MGGFFPGNESSNTKEVPSKGIEATERDVTSQSDGGLFDDGSNGTSSSSVPSTGIKTAKQVGREIQADGGFFDGNPIGSSTIDGQTETNRASAGEFATTGTGSINDPFVPAVHTYTRGDFVLSFNQSYTCILGYNATALSAFPLTDTAHWV